MTSLFESHRLKYRSPQLEIKKTCVEVTRVGACFISSQPPAAGSLNSLIGFYDYVRKVDKNIEFRLFRNGCRGIIDDDFLIPDEEFFSRYVNLVGIPEVRFSTFKNSDALKKKLEDLDFLLCVGEREEILQLEKLETSCRFGFVAHGDVLVDNQIPVGYDTSLRFASDLAGNYAIESISSKSHYHFVRLHDSLSLDVALEIHPTLVIFNELIRAEKLSLTDVVEEISECIRIRFEAGLKSGLIFVSYNFFNTFQEKEQVHKLIQTKDEIPEELQEFFLAMPKEFLVKEIPIHYHDIAPLRALSHLVCKSLRKKKVTIQTKTHCVRNTTSFGLPTNFDCDYGYKLGQAAGEACFSSSLRRVVCCVENLRLENTEWKTKLVDVEKIEKYHTSPVLREVYEKLKDRWRLGSPQRQPGPIQYFCEPNERCLSLLAGTRTSNEILELLDFAENCRLPTDCRHHIFFKRQFNSTPLQIERRDFELRLPTVLKHKFQFDENEVLTMATRNIDLLKLVFPSLIHSKNVEIVPWKPSIFGSPFDENVEKKIRLGICVFGRLAPGATNCIVGIFERLKKQGKLIGILHGAKGLMSGCHLELTEDIIQVYRNQGGIDLLGRSYLNITTLQEMRKCAETCRRLRLDGLTIVGGVGSNTDLVALAEYFAATCPTKVVGIPCQAESNFPFVEQAVGFDTTVQVLSSLVGNLASNARLFGNKHYIIRIAGDTSHLGKEIARRVNSSDVYLVEKLKKHWRLSDLCASICDRIEERSLQKKNYSITLITDRVVLDLEEFHQLFHELDTISSERPEILESSHTVSSRLSPSSGLLLLRLPEEVQKQLLVSRTKEAKLEQGQDNLLELDTEVILKHAVVQEMNRRMSLGLRRGGFRIDTDCLSYQARGSLPSNLDATLGYVLGYAAACFLERGWSGYSVHASKLNEPVEDWRILGSPLISSVRISESTSRAEIVFDIATRSVDYVEEKHNEDFHVPGPVQFSGPEELMRLRSQVPEFDVLEDLKKISQASVELRSLASSTCSRNVCQAVSLCLENAIKTIKLLTENESDDFCVNERHVASKCRSLALRNE